MTHVRPPEFWVVRAILHCGRPLQLSHKTMTEGVYNATYAKVTAGDYVLLPDFTIAEPVEVFTTEPEAHAHRLEMVAKHPGVDFRVILNADIAV